MTTEHSDVAGELWSLAETVLTRLEPLLRQAAQEQKDRPRQGCSWCPICALSALLRGEQHDLLTLLSSEGATIVALVRQMISEHSGTPAPSSPRGSPKPTPQPWQPESSAEPDGTVDDGEIGRPFSSTGEAGESTIRRAAFEPITVTVKEPTRSDPQDRG